MYPRQLYIVVYLLWLQAGPLKSAEPTVPPKVMDRRIQIQLFAEHPRIVTPIGMAIRDDGRVFVLESHTHSRPSDYGGPHFDRVKILQDTDADGRADTEQVFADGITAGMNLAFSPDGTLYLACAKEVIALPDEDRDGICDEKRQVLRLDTEETYPHSCLLSLAFSRRGELFVGRGNTGSRAWKLTGRDGSSIQGYGDGGNIVRCKVDGTNVSEFATGFWNPFGLNFDRSDRLLCVDNDPDARGPNRLVHVVEGADFGYRSLFGGGGYHPYQGWDGDLPGTLPIASGTGEAPCDLLDVKGTCLSREGRSEVVVSIWNENTIERHELHARGISIEGRGSRLVQGEQEFRPVAICKHPDGDVYICDWVLVNYPNHGHGRIWRITSHDDPRDITKSAVHADFTMPRFEDVDALRSASSSSDAFTRHAAVMALSDLSQASLIPEFFATKNPQLRLAALLAADRSLHPTLKQMLRRSLTDVDSKIRRQALLIIGNRGLIEFRDSIQESVKVNVPRNDVGRLIDTYLATTTLLDDNFISARRLQSHSKSNQIPRQSSDSEAIRLAFDSELTKNVRIAALRRIVRAEFAFEQIQDMLRSETDAQLRIAAIDALRGIQTPSATVSLLNAAKDSQPEVRAEGVAAIVSRGSRDSDLGFEAMVRFLRDSNTDVQLEAARGFRRRSISAAERDSLRMLFAGSEAYSPEVNRHLRWALSLEESLDGPASDAEWQQALRDGGSAKRGRRVFLSAAATCTKCHTIDGNEQTLGPNLGNLAQSVSRSDIIESIIDPSKQFAPQYQAWQIITTHGQVLSGLQLDHKARGAIEILTVDGTTKRFEADEIESYDARQTSLMPDGLEENLTVDEMKDLVAYLAEKRQ